MFCVIVLAKKGRERLLCQTTPATPSWPEFLISHSVHASQLSIYPTQPHPNSLTPFASSIQFPVNNIFITFVISCSSNPFEIKENAIMLKITEKDGNWITLVLGKMNFKYMEKQQENLDFKPCLDSLTTWYNVILL